MKILLVSNYLPDAQQSMQRYAGLLERELRARGYEVETVRPEVIAGRLLPAGHALSKWLGYIDKFLLFPRVLRELSRSTDIVHICDHSNAPWLRHAKYAARIITCHDVLAIRSALGYYPENRTGWSGRMLQKYILRGLRHAENVICVSHRTKDDLLELLPAPPQHLQVIHHSLNWNYCPMPLEEVREHLRGLQQRISGRYLLHIGANQWYKNRPGVLRIFSELRKLDGFRDLTLVMAGKPWTAQMRSLCAELGIGKYVREIVAPSNEQVQALYSGAFAFLFPSLDEGFGWPILEAQSCGCPVVTTNLAPMTEIAGEGAILIDPQNATAAALCMAEGLTDRERLIEAGWGNLRRFQTDAMIARYAAFYDQLMRASQPVA